MEMMNIRVSRCVNDSIQPILGMLEKITTAMVSDLAWVKGGGEIKMLKVITDPFTKLIIQVSFDSTTTKTTTVRVYKYILYACFVFM